MSRPLRNCRRKTARDVFQNVRYVYVCICMCRVCTHWLKLICPTYMNLKLGLTRRGHEARVGERDGAGAGVWSRAGTWVVTCLSAIKRGCPLYLEGKLWTARSTIWAVRTIYYSMQSECLDSMGMKPTTFIMIQLSFELLDPPFELLEPSITTCRVKALTQWAWNLQLLSLSKATELSL